MAKARPSRGGIEPLWQSPSQLLFRHDDEDFDDALLEDVYECDDPLDESDESCGLTHFSDARCSDERLRRRLTSDWSYADWSKAFDRLFEDYCEDTNPRNLYPSHAIALYMLGCFLGTISSFTANAYQGFCVPVTMQYLAWRQASLVWCELHIAFCLGTLFLSLYQQKMPGFMDGCYAALLSTLAYRSTSFVLMKGGVQVLFLAAIIMLRGITRFVALWRRRSSSFACGSASECLEVHLLITALVLLVFSVVSQWGLIAHALSHSGHDQFFGQSVVVRVASSVYEDNHATLREMAGIRHGFVVFVAGMTNGRSPITSNSHQTRLLQKGNTMTNATNRSEFSATMPMTIRGEAKGSHNAIPYKIDLHTHSGASDGAGDLADLLRAARDRNIQILAVTDHDALRTAEQAYGYLHHLQRVGSKTSPLVIPGIEVSSKIERAGRPTDVIHILGLGIDPFAETLVRICAQRDVARREELRRRIDHVRSLGYRLSAHAEARVLDAFWGRGELCRELVLNGTFASVDEAYHAVWDSYPRTSGTEEHIAAATAIAAIHDAGGFALLAHPFRDEINHGRFVTREEVMQRIETLMPLGLDGIEAWYRSFSFDDCLWLDNLATSRGLKTSAGSDHHDFGKRFHLGHTCADADETNIPAHASVLAALGL